MLKLAFPAKQDDDVILVVQVRCRSCLYETFPLVPVSRQPAGRSDRAYFLARQLWQQMPFRCHCGHTAADLVNVEYPTQQDMRVKPDLFPNLGLPRLMRCV